MLCLIAALLPAQPLRAQEYRKGGGGESEQAERQQAWQLKGRLQNAVTGRPVPAAQLKVKGKVIDQLTRSDGRFQLTVTGQDSARLQIRHVSYQAHAVTFRPSTPADTTIQLTPDNLKVDQIVVSASRTPERYMSSPVTIERMDVQDLEQSAATDVYDAVANLKSVDTYNHSLLFQSLNTRGFNNTLNTRFVTRQAGMDVQMPGLNTSFNAIFGPPEIDVASAELIPGAASAIYGPNALNGLLNIKTKSPFAYPGFSVEAKAGLNHVNSNAYGQPQPLGAVQMRYAETLAGGKLGFKISGKFKRGTDWVATDRRDRAAITDAYAGLTNTQFPANRSNPGYDGNNIYGDLVASVFDSAGTAQQFGLPYTDGPTRISRNGYRERAVTHDPTWLASGNASIHYKPTDELELILYNQVAQTDARFQGENRFQLDNLLIHAHKLEARGDHWFARAYMMRDDAMNTYDALVAGVGVERAWKTEQQWFGQYLFSYGLDVPGSNLTTNTFINQFLQAQGRPPIPARNHAAARQFANSNNQGLYSEVLPFLRAAGPSFGLTDSAAQVALARTLTEGGSRPQPGSERFQALLDSVRQVPFNKGGARLRDRSWFYQAEGQYDFSHLIDWQGFSLLGGLNFRRFRPISGGSVFADTAGQRFSAYEYGAYGQAQQTLLDERLQLQASLRMDKHEVTDPLFSPRASLVLNLGAERQHYLRANVQRAYRMPSMRELYVDLSGRLGSHPRLMRGYGLRRNGRSNAYTGESVSAYLATQAAQRSPDQLERYKTDVVDPERLEGVSIGYRANLWDRLAIDLEYYYQRFYNFIEAQPVYGPDLQNPGPDESPRLTPQDIDSSAFTRYPSLWGNAEQVMYTHGVSAGVNLALTDAITLKGNYNYNAMLAGQDQSRFPFSTPPHKFNVGAVADGLLLDHLLLSANYRWVDGFRYSPVVLAQGAVSEPRTSAYQTLDAKVAYTVPGLKTTFTLGASNLLNQYYQTLSQAPSIGGIYYLKVSFDEFLNR